jgi:hypothetical protein
MSGASPVPAGPLTSRRSLNRRHLDEALTHRADPLHIAVVFGLSPKAALRYANTAKQLVATTIENDPTG